jgi:predicted GIY-YIG superfamily endonuclease
MSDKPLTHALYRHFAADGTLLYVGITMNAPRRLKEHSRHSGWWDNVARVEIEQFPTRAAVIDAERHAIKLEKPLHNFMHNRALPQDKITTAVILGEEIKAKVVNLRPLYRIKDAAEILGISTVYLRKAIGRGEIAPLTVLNSKDRPVEMISGWHLIWWLEYLGAFE